MIKIWTAGSGLWADAANWQGGAPVYRDLAVIPSSSAVDCRGVYLSGVTLLLEQTTDKPVLFSLNTATLGVSSSITTLGDVTLTIQDATLLGTTYFSSGNVSVSINPSSFATNAGNMIVYSGSGPASVTVNADRGAFSTTGAMHVETNGTLDITYGGTFPTTPQSISNTGTVEASDGGKITFDATHAFTRSFGILNNSGVIDANGGTVTINSDLNQSDTGIVQVENNGTLNLDGVVTAGMIRITSGMLEFGLFGRSNPGPIASESFASRLVLDGIGASLGFGSVPIAEAFNESAQELVVTAPFGGLPTVIGDFRLGGPSAFLASEFKVGTDGSSVLFTRAPISG
jgi:hypothetical protein